MREFRTIFDLVKKHRIAFLVGPIFVLVTNSLRVVSPELVQFAIDFISDEDEAPSLAGRTVLATADTLGLTYEGAAIVTLTAAMIITAALCQGVFQFSMRYVMIGASRRVEFDLRQRVFDHLQTLPPSAFESMRIGDIMTRSTSDIESIRMCVGPAIMYLTNTLTVLPICLVMMFFKNPALALLSMIPLALLTIAIRLIMPRMYKHSRAVQEQMSAISTHAQENFSGVRVVKAFHREQHEIDGFHELNGEYVRANLRLAWSRGLVNGVINVFAGVGVALVLWFGGRDIINGNLTLGQFIAFNQYQLMLIWPMIAMGWVLSLLQRGVASMERINEILSIEPAIRDESSGTSEPIRGEIEFRGFSFAYGDTPLLQNIDLSIPAGHTVAIVGRTGSGKSTLVSALPRLLEVPRHRVFVDGREIHEIPLEQLRASIGMVPQDTFLFSDTVRNNIAFGRPDATDAEIREAAKIAGIDETIDELPNGYEQMIGERGVNLSGGQKQRLAIARALVKDPAVLILDDCLSAVDTETEERILSGLRPKMRGRTCIVVAHRVSTIKDADHIVVIDEGTIAEEGSHDELVAANGIYAEIERRQKLEDELERFG